MEQHYHSYPRTPFASSRRSPRWEASHVIFGSLLLSNKSRSLATSRGNEKFRKAFLLSADRPRMTVGRQHKNTDTNPCQTVLRASQNQASTLSIQESPAATLNLSSGNAGSCCKGWYPCFCFVVKLFYESAESVPTSLGPGKSRRGIGSLYTGIHDFPTCQSCIPAGIFAIYMAD